LRIALIGTKTESAIAVHTVWIQRSRKFHAFIRASARASPRIAVGGDSKAFETSCTIVSGVVDIAERTGITCLGVSRRRGYAIAFATHVSWFEFLRAATLGVAFVRAEAESACAIYAVGIVSLGILCALTYRPARAGTHVFVSETDQPR